MSLHLSKCQIVGNLMHCIIYFWLPLSCPLSTGHRSDAFSGDDFYTMSRGRDFQQFDILTSVDSDDPLQQPFKLRNSKWCSVSSLIIIKYSSN